MQTTLESLHQKKRNGLPITMVTAYDFPTARIEDEAGVDSILVGDSVGTNVLGYASEREVTMADMLHHVAAVARGVQRAFLLADLPYQAADTAFDAEKNSLRMLEKGACAVKIEGWQEKRDIVAHLTNKNIPVCAHIGYNPQIHGARPKVYGSAAAEALALFESALALEEAGASLIVLEKIPREVAGVISKTLRIPTIGIGSGNLCDGQVLVINDLLGVSKKQFRHARKYLDFHAGASSAVQAYAADVGKRAFPAAEHSHGMDPKELGKFEGMLGRKAAG